MSDWSSFAPRHFLWQLRDRVATITLNRPERKNPLTFDSYAELRDTFRALANSPDDVRCVLLTGAGGNFSSGGDVHEIIGPLVQAKDAGQLEVLSDFTQMTGELVKAMRACPQPIVAAVDGTCAGAGAILAMASDIRLASDAARVAFLFTRVGLSGADMGACAILPRIIGHGRASELLFTGRFMDADEGERWGFFSRVVPRDTLLADAERLAQSLATGPSRAHAVTKKALHDEWAMDVDAAISYEARVQAECMTTEDFARAYRAFVARSTPVFEGN